VNGETVGLAYQDERLKSEVLYPAFSVNG